MSRKPHAKVANKKTRNLWWIFAVAATIIVIVVAYVLLSQNSKQDLAPAEDDNPNANTSAEAFSTGPKNFIQDGITIEEDSKVTSVTTEGEEAGATFEASEYTAREDGKTTVSIIVDPQCPICKTFEDTNGELLKEYADEGKIALEYHPISFLDKASTNMYSSRATNALACVADQAPDSFFEFLTNLYTNQKPENGPGLSNGTIHSIAVESGAADTEELETCIYSKQFMPWVIDSTVRTLSGEPLPGTDGTPVTGTPAVFINGESVSIDPSDAAAFKKKLDSYL